MRIGTDSAWQNQQNGLENPVCADVCKINLQLMFISLTISSRSLLPLPVALPFLLVFVGGAAALDDSLLNASNMSMIETLPYARNNLCDF